MGQKGPGEMTLNLGEDGRWVPEGLRVLFHKLLLIDWNSLRHHNHVQGFLRSSELVLCGGKCRVDVRAQRSGCADWLETTELK